MRREPPRPPAAPRERAPLARAPAAPVATARALILALLGILALAAGCCTPPRPLEDMHARNLRTPLNTLDYFRTAIRYRDWDAAYATLSPRSQAYVDEKVGRWVFATFAEDAKLEDLDDKAPREYRDLTLGDLVHRSEILRVDPDADRPDRVRVQLYLSIGAAPIPTEKTRIPLIRVHPAKPGERARWTVGLIEWLEGE
jgi:hypothetical protein